MKIIWAKHPFLYSLMSSNTSSATNNTNTSTSRRGKKSTQSSSEVVVPEPNIEVVQELTIEVPKSEVEEATPVVQVEKAPPVNFWKEKMRRDAEAAVQKAKEALKAAEEASASVEKTIKSAQQATSHTKKVESESNEKSEDKDGWETVNTKRKGPFKGKPQPARAHTQTKPVAQVSEQAPAKIQSKPVTGDKQGFKPKQGSDQQPRKPRDQKFVPKEPTEEQVAYRARKAAALEIAQKAMIQECVNAFPSNSREDVNSQLRFVINYRKTLVIDVSQDIPVQHEGETFQFSRERFMENRYFQNLVRDAFVSLVPDGWLRFFQGRNEGTYCIGIQLRRN